VISGQIRVNDKQYIGIIYHRHFQQRVPRDTITRVGNFVLGILHFVAPYTIGEIVGSYRRGKESSGDVDILISGTTEELHRLFNALKGMRFIEHELAMGVKSVRGTFWSNYPTSPASESRTSEPFDSNLIQQFLAANVDGRIGGVLHTIDIKVVPLESWGTGLLHYTGSDVFNEGVRAYLKKQGLSLSEYGISTVDQSKKWVYKTEADVFRSIGLPFIPPTERETFNL
jgi:DNA polymerase/3'-5' exonuclease PolX